jgi:hypothetical protein
MKVDGSHSRNLLKKYGILFVKLIPNFVKFYIGRLRLAPQYFALGSAPFH